MHRASSQRAQGRPGSRGSGFSFADASDILDKAAAVGKLVPVVGEALEGVLQLASVICKDVETVKSNREDLRALAKDAALCTWAIASRLKDIDQAERSKYNTYIEDLKGVCEDIDKVFERLGKSGRVQQFLKRSAHESQISNLRSQLAAACTRFGISIHLASKISLDQLQQSVVSMGQDIKAIRQKQIDSELRAKEIRQAQIDSEIRASLERLNPVSAAYNSDAVDKSVQYCAKDTRIELLTQIMDWARDDKIVLPVYWLSGLAGTGKSTVARTVCDRLAKEGLLVASFFISRPIAERSDPAQIPRSLAYQIAACSPKIAYHISTAINTNPGITTRSISDQIDILITQPLQKASPLLSPLVIVIDALDECEKRDDREGGHLLPCVASALSHPTLKRRVKLLITSREEATIQKMFSEIRDTHGFHAVLQLHMIDAVTVQMDIKLYLEDNLHRIAARFPSLVETGWPSESDIHHLVDYSGVLFVVASTLVRFLDSSKHNPARLLQSVMENETKAYGSPYDAVDALYTFVLDAAVNSAHDPEDILCRRLRLVLGTILAAEDPISPRLLALIINEDEVDTMLMLESLRSILVLIHPDNPVQIFHQSLRDFVTNPDRCMDQRLFVDISSGHQQLAIAYLKIVDDPPFSNIFDFESELSEPSQTLSYGDKFICHEHSRMRQGGFNSHASLARAWRQWGHHICLVQNASTGLLHELHLLCSRARQPSLRIDYLNTARVLKPVFPWCLKQGIYKDITARLLVLLFESAFDMPRPIISTPVLFQGLRIGVYVLACHFDELNSFHSVMLGHILHICHNIWLDHKLLLPLNTFKMTSSIVQALKAIHTMPPQDQQGCIPKLIQIQRLLKERKHTSRSTPASRQIAREIEDKIIHIVCKIEGIACPIVEITKRTIDDVTADFTRAMLDILLSYLYPTLASDK